MLIAEIQGLRALAVLLVLVFHVWPDSIPGGYVGVDVFFVISGYLITGALLRELRRDGRIRLGAFYARRARRLLPAASLVLLATLLGSLWLLPASRWQGIALEVAASAAYVQNWVLAASSVDYWAAENAASPLQHFWSLSIEEQFYLVWPLALLAAAGAGTRGIGLTKSLVGVMVVVLVASFAASVWLTASAPEQAYFLTYTRVWELALGGLLALLPASTALRGMAADVCATAGLLLILAAAFLLTTGSAFPGYLALLPVVGAALVLHAGEVGRGPVRLLRSGPLRWVGDRSYSIYLWHWPLVVWYGHAFDGIDLAGGVGVIAITLLLAHLTYEYVEQPFRRGDLRVGRALATGAVSVGVCVLGAGAVHAMVARMEAVIPVSAQMADYPGPAVLADGIPAPDGVPFVPRLISLASDRPETNRLGCAQGEHSAEPTYCEFGDATSTQTVALVGDSHAGQWAPTLARIAEAEGWRLLTYTKSACPFADVDATRNGRPYESCNEWRLRVMDELSRQGVQRVFTSLTRGANADKDYLAEGLLRLWAQLKEAGIQVVAIADTPWFPFRPDDCLASNPAHACAADRSVVVPAVDPLKVAAEKFQSAVLIDMTDYLCTSDTCAMVVGNVVAWRDRHHLTATYAAALAPYLARELGLDEAKFAITALSNSAPSIAGEEIMLRVKCDGRGESEGIEVRVFAYVHGSEVTVVRGGYETREGSFDYWHGVRQDGQIELVGEYSFGKVAPRPVRFSGTWSDDGIRLSGKHGWRNCEVIHSWSNTSAD